MSPPLTCTTRASITCPSRPRTRSFARRGEGRPRGHDASASRRARLERYRSSRTRPLPFRRPRRVDSPRFARDAPNASEASSARCPLSRGSRCSRRPCTWRASPPLDAPRPLTPRRSRAPTRRRRGTRRRRPRARETALLRWKMNRRGRRRRGNARAVQRAPGRASRTRTRRRMTAVRRLRGRRSPRTSSPPPPPPPPASSSLLPRAIPPIANGHVIKPPPLCAPPFTYGSSGASSFTMARTSPPRFESSSPTTHSCRTISRVWILTTANAAYAPTAAAPPTRDAATNTLVGLFLFARDGSTNRCQHDANAL